MIAIQEQKPSSVCFLELYLGYMLIFFSSFGIFRIQIPGEVFFFHLLFKLEYFNSEIENCTTKVVPLAKYKHRTPSIQKFPAETSPRRLQQTMPQL